MGFQIPALGVKWNVHTLPKFSLVLVWIFCLCVWGFCFPFIYLFVLAIYFFSVKLKELCGNILWKNIGVLQQDWFSVWYEKEHVSPLQCGAWGCSPAQQLLWNSFFIHISKEPVLVPLQNENKCQSSGTPVSHFQVSTVHVGLWQLKVVMTIYSSYRPCTVPSWEQPGSLLSLIN